MNNYKNVKVAVLNILI